VLAVTSRRPFDCGVAAIACFCSVDYADAFFVAAKVAGPLLKEGLSIAQMQAIALRFQWPLSRKHWRRVDIEEDEGILGINYQDPKHPGHWVVLRRGIIIDPDPFIARFTDADLYMHTHRARPGTLLVETP